MKKLVTTFFSFLFVTVACAQMHPNTLSYDSLVGSPNASIDQVSWISGHWQGEAFGGIAEEIWSEPMGGSMMFVFRLVSEGKVGFYEAGGILEQDGSLVLRLKHFDDQFHGWEEKDETVDFRLIKLDGNRAYFDGFTIEKISEDEINMYVLIGHEGEEEEVKFNYHRVK